MKRKYRLGAMVMVCVVMLCGCLPPPQLPGPERAKALQLIDQGTLQLRRGELRKAQASYQMAYDLAKLPQGLDGLGCVALLRGEHKLAEDYFQTALERDPSYDTALGNLALLYDLMGRHDEAREYYRRALAAQPLNVRARGNFGAFLADKEVGKEFEGEREILHAQALGNNPIIEENLRRLAQRRNSRS